MYIVKITNGRVELYNERGCYQRTIVSSNAVFADIDMTQHYLHVQEPVRQAAIEKFANAFQKTDE